MCRSRKAFKLSTKFFDNRKTKIILDMENGSKMVVIWLKLLALAGQNDFNGALYITDDIPYTPNELSNVLHEQVEDILKALYVFEKYSMILVDDDGVITIKNWEKYQNEDEGEYYEEYVDGSEAEEDEWLIRKRVLAAERKRRQRAREKDCEDDVTLMSRSCHADVTQESVTCHAPVTQESSSSPTPPLTQRTPVYINNNILTSQENEKKGNKEETESKTKRKVFRKPSVEEIAAYCTERKNGIDPEAFFDKYEANGWVDKNGNPMKDWKATIRTWERWRKENPTKFGKQNASKFDYGTEADYDEYGFPIGKRD